MGDLPPLIEFLEFIFIRDPIGRPTMHDVITKFSVTKPIILQHLATAEHAVDHAMRECSESNVLKTSTCTLNGHDTIGEKYTTRESTSSMYSPGRYTPHILQPTSFHAHTPATARLRTPQTQLPSSQSSSSQPSSQTSTPQTTHSQTAHSQSSNILLSNTQPPLSPSQAKAHAVSQSTPSSPSQPPQPKTQPAQLPQSTNRQVILASPKVTPRDSPFDLPPDPPIELEFPEHEYFMCTPSQITPFLYVSSYNPSLDRAMLKHKLHITHIINCTGISPLPFFFSLFPTTLISPPLTYPSSSHPSSSLNILHSGSPNAFPDYFEYLHLKLHDENSQDILAPLQRVLDFIRDGLSHGGRVLIYSHKVLLFLSLPLSPSLPTNIFVGCK
jgi:hypothetical protein